MPRKFDFISPGVQLREVDESQITPTPDDDGLLLIGRAPRGPAMKPVKINNFSDFREVFGDPVSGKNPSEDNWRDGNFSSPMYAMYAAQAYLASGVAPVKFVRLLGEADPDATTGGEAGWKIADGPDTSATFKATSANVSAYGLFITPSGAAEDMHRHPGTLAAVFYVSGTSIQLAGEPASGSAVPLVNVTGAARLIKSIGANSTFKLILSGAGTSGVGVIEQHTVNFDPTDQNSYVRNLLSTNPQRLKNNENFGATDVKYFLGETYEQAVQNSVNDISSSSGHQYGVILALQSGSAVENWGYNLGNAQAAQSGWFISQQPQQEQLFKFVALSEGADFQKRYKVLISDLVLGKREIPSTFTVNIVEGSDNRVIEQYTGCTLDPGRSDYIARKIGDQRLVWDSVEKRFNNEGLHPNRSDLVRVEMSSLVANRTLTNKLSLPVGFRGPLRPNGFSIISGSANIHTLTAPAAGAPVWGTAVAGRQLNAFVTGGVDIPNKDGRVGSSATGEAGTFPRTVQVQCGNTKVTASFTFPALRLTSQNSARGGNGYGHTYPFGIDHRRSAASRGQDGSYNDILRELPGSLTHFLAEGATPNSSAEYSFTFTLDDLRQRLDAAGLGERNFYFEEGSYANNNSVTRKSDLKTLLTNTVSGGVRQFVAPFMGGRDGLDILEADPFDNTNIGSDVRSNYERATLEKALDIVSDPEYCAYDLLSIPGITDNNITDRVLQNAASRTDHLAIIDLDGGFVPGYDGQNGVDQDGSVSATVTNLENRFINNSYATAYYPSVLLGDTINDVNLIVPPSIAGIGAIAASERASQPWFAPAGFNRGGLNPLGGPNGPRVLDTNERLTKGLRDELYAAKINPIANFSAAGGIVVFGQKTLQLQQSALDRINVRRLMVFIKKRIGAVARNLLFDQAVDVTFGRFRSQAGKILQSVKSNFGITEFKIVLDETTTTPDLIDQNIMYAQIFVKPARAIEFIAIDFVISRSGVEFE